MGAPLVSAQSTNSGSIIVGYYYDVTAGRTLTGGPPNPHSLWCQPPQQYYNLPATGATFSAFQTYVDLSQTNVCGSIRFGLYEVTGSLYTLVVGTNRSSDIQVCPSFATGPSLVTTTAPLYYPSGSSSLTMSPTSTYSLCVSNEGDELTVPGTQRSGTIYMYYWQDAYTSLSTVNLNYYFDQPLPLLNPMVNQPTDWAFQVWMTVTAPVISWSFAYSVQGQLTADSSSAFSVCTVGSILTALTPDCHECQQLYHIPDVRHSHVQQRQCHADQSHNEPWPSGCGWQRRSALSNHLSLHRRQWSHLHRQHLPTLPGWLVHSQHWLGADTQPVRQPVQCDG